MTAIQNSNDGLKKRKSRHKKIKHGGGGGPSESKFEADQAKKKT